MSALIQLSNEVISAHQSGVVMAAGDGLLAERVALVRELREAGIKVRRAGVAMGRTRARER